MGHDDQRARAHVLDELLHHVAARLVVQVAGGLVGEDDVGALDQRAGDGHALLLAAGQRAHAPLLHRQDAQAHKQRVLAGGVHVLHAQNVDVVLHGHVLDELEVLIDVAHLPDAEGVAAALGPGVDGLAAHGNCALGGGQHAGDHVQKGGFAAARRAQQHIGLAVLKGEIRIANRRAVVEPHAERLGLYHCEIPPYSYEKVYKSTPLGHSPGAKQAYGFYGGQSFI